MTTPSHRRLLHPSELRADRLNRWLLPSERPLQRLRMLFVMLAILPCAQLVILMQRAPTDAYAGRVLGVQATTSTLVLAGTALVVLIILAGIVRFMRGAADLGPTRVLGLATLAAEAVSLAGLYAIVGLLDHEWDAGPLEATLQTMIILTILAGSLYGSYAFAAIRALTVFCAVMLCEAVTSRESFADVFEIAQQLPPIVVMALIINLLARIVLAMNRTHARELALRQAFGHFASAPSLSRMVDEAASAASKLTGDERARSEVLLALEARDRSEIVASLVDADMIADVMDGLVRFQQLEVVSDGTPDGSPGLLTITPIAYDHQLRGMLVVRSPRALDPDALPALVDLCRAFAISLKDVRHRELLTYHAYHDDLTGVANRQAFMAELEESVAALERVHEPFMLLFLDLDRFKPINDSHGHEAGDLVLRTVARRVERTVGERGLVARLGGDEFAVLVRNCEDLRASARLAQALAEAIEEPIRLRNGHEAHVGVSTGVTPGVPSAPESLRRADAAMYLAKREGGRDEAARRRAA